MASLRPEHGPVQKPGFFLRSCCLLLRAIHRGQVVPPDRLVVDLLDVGLFPVSVAVNLPEPGADGGLCVGMSEPGPAFPLNFSQSPALSVAHDGDDAAQLTGYVDWSEHHLPLRLGPSNPMALPPSSLSRSRQRAPMHSRMPSTLRFESKMVGNWF